MATFFARQSVGEKIAAEKADNETQRHFDALGRCRRSIAGAARLARGCAAKITFQIPVISRISHP